MGYESPSQHTLTTVYENAHCQISTGPRQETHGIPSVNYFSESSTMYRNHYIYHTYNSHGLEDTHKLNEEHKLTPNSYVP